MTLPPPSLSRCLYSLKTQAVVSGPAAKGSSDAERLIITHTAQRGLETTQHMMQPKDIGQKQCYLERRGDGVREALGLNWQFETVGHYHRHLMVALR